MRVFDAAPSRLVAFRFVKAQHTDSECKLPKVLDEAERAGHAADATTWHTLLESARYLERPEITQAVR